MKYLIGLFGLILAIGILSIILINTPETDVSSNSEKETVRVASIFGCLPLADRYTDAEWQAKEELDTKLFKYHLVRCP